MKERKDTVNRWYVIYDGLNERRRLRGDKKKRKDGMEWDDGGVA